MQGSEHIIFDTTHVISHSEKLLINQPGYNSQQDFYPQLCLLYALSVDKKSPSYYRILPGNIRDVTAFKLSVEEANLSNAVIITDKGFGSAANIDIGKTAISNILSH